MIAATLAGAGVAAGAGIALPAGAAIDRPSPRGAALWADPGSQALRALSRLQTTVPYRVADVAGLTALAAQPQGIWITASLSPEKARARVDAAATAADAAGRVPTFVLYAVPKLDCRTAGIATAAGYRAWIEQVRLGLGERRAIVIVEPDALAMIGCLSTSRANERYALLRHAVTQLSTSPLTSVYLDAGHAGWQSSTTMARRLGTAGVSLARGFSLNVSNFGRTADEIAYGKRVSAKLAEPRPFVVDVGRNGLGPDVGPLAWCNPPGRALGERPTTTVDDPQVDALLWIKPPGESDGTCRPGEPSAGKFWLDYALGLAARASWVTAPPTDPTQTAPVDPTPTATATATTTPTATGG